MSGTCTLQDAANKYTPDKVGKVFSVMPDWRYMLNGGAGPVYYVHSSASPADVERYDHPDRARDSEGGVDEHLGSTKAAGESDAEYVLRAGRYDIRKDEEWRGNTSAETEDMGPSSENRGQERSTCETARRRHLSVRSADAALMSTTGRGPMESF